MTQPDFYSHKTVMVKLAKQLLYERENTYG